MSGSRPRVLVVYREVGAFGGGSIVGASVLAALKDSYDVSLLSWREVDYEGVRKYYGVALEPGDFEVVLVPSAYRRWLERFPAPGAQLQLGLMMRACRRLLREREFDVVIGADNEADFGRRGIQYVHYPWAKYPRPADELRWYHRVPGLLRLYRFGAITLLGCSVERLRRNVTLVNSEFVGEEVRQAHGIKPELLYPPVRGIGEGLRWSDRANRIVCIGRLFAEKRWVEAVEIVRRVRAHGHDVSLRIIGNQGDATYLGKLRALESRYRDWLKVSVDEPRAELERVIATSKFGMHCMVDEHFGIAVAELVLGGCIPFVHASGGPAEIVGRESELCFSTLEDAVERVEKALTDEQLQERLRSRLASHGERFGAERFQQGIRSAVSGFISAEAPEP